MKVRSIVVMVAGVSGLLAGAAEASVAVEPPANQPHARVTLVSEQAQVQPGTTAYLGVHFQLEPHWHVYWPGRSDSGGPIELDLKLPPGFTALTSQWPAPQRLVSEGEIVDHVYEDEVTIIVPVKIDDSVQGPATITGTAKYVICSSACVFEDAKFELALPVAPAGKPKIMSEHAKLFQATRARLPRPAPTGQDALKVQRTGRSLNITVPGAKGLTFFPGPDCAMLADFAASGLTKSDKMVLKLESSEPETAPIDGLLEVRYADSRPTAWFVVGLPERSSEGSEKEDAKTKTGDSHAESKPMSK